MAWTTPRTWVAAEIATAANLNTHLRDNLNALYGTDSTYTPTFAQGTSTNIGKTVNEARYIRTGRIVDVWLRITSTGSGTAGSAFTLTLPVTASGHASSGVAGQGFISDSSAGTIDVGTALFASTTTVLLISETSTGSGWGATPNLAIGSGDVIGFYLRYVVA